MAENSKTRAEKANDWIDNTDSYICPRCRNEENNPGKYVMNRCPKCGWSPLDGIDIEYAPIVRCGKCDHYWHDECHNPEGPFGASMNPDDFFSYGERKKK